jgi:hypothetical protein
LITYSQFSSENLLYYSFQNLIPVENQLDRDVIQLVSLLLDFSDHFSDKVIFKEIIEFVQFYPLEVLYLFSKVSIKYGPNSKEILMFLPIYTFLLELQLILDYEKIIFYLILNHKIQISQQVFNIFCRYPSISIF